MRPISQTTTQKLSHCRRDDATLYASLELSQATWLVTSLSPGSEKMSKHSTLGGDRAALLGLLRRLQLRAERLAGGEKYPCLRCAGGPSPRPRQRRHRGANLFLQSA